MHQSCNIGSCLFGRTSTLNLTSSCASLPSPMSYSHSHGQGVRESSVIVLTDEEDDGIQIISNPTNATGQPQHRNNPAARGDSRLLNRTPIASTSRPMQSQSRNTSAAHAPNSQRRTPAPNHPASFGPVSLGLTHSVASNSLSLGKTSTTILHFFAAAEKATIGQRETAHFGTRHARLGGYYHRWASQGKAGNHRNS